MQTPLASGQLRLQPPTAEQLLVRVPTLPQDHHDITEGEDRMTEKMTEWFPVNIKPVHVGVYETDLAGYLGYSYWNGKFWSDTSYKLDMERVIKRRRGMQNKEWRGFKEKQ
jgi:hypothetical protein